MSFIEASQLASAGASQVIASHRAPPQTVSNGVINLIADGKAKPLTSQPLPISARQGAMGGSPDVLRGKSRYEILRMLTRVAPHTALGVEAHVLLARRALLSRSGLSQQALRPQLKAVDRVVQKVVQTPALIISARPDLGRKLGLTFSGAAKSPDAYRILKQGLNALPTASRTTISLRQLPQLGKGLLMRSLKSALSAAVPSQPKPAMRSKNTRLRNTPVYSFA